MSRSLPLDILVVEDDEGMALLVRERLEEIDGWGVTTAGSAAECRAAVAVDSFDIVLLDRGLPDCDGASLITELLALKPDLAIVMLTGADSARSATETLQLGAWDYVVKQPDLSYLDALPGVLRRCAERIHWKREEARLRGEMDLLMAAMRAEADAVVVTEADGRVRFWNAAAEQLFGWSAEEVVGQPLPLIPEDRMDRFAEIGEHARQGKPLVGVEIALQRRGGSPIDVGLTLTAVNAPDGTLRGYVAVIRDVSERKQLERDRADFVAMLTHDIKNPVMVIHGNAEELAEADLPAELLESAHAIERAAMTISTLVSDFLTSQNIERGSLKLTREPVPVGDLVAYCVKQFRAAAARSSIELAPGPDPGGVTVAGDRLQLERCLTNLIGNAIKYCRGTGGKVTVTASCESDAVLLEVADTGPGIPADELPFVFDKYRRNKGTHRIEGVGLGLSIVRHLVGLHGGTVGVRSEVGQGTTFTIRLPRG